MWYTTRGCVVKGVSLFIPCTVLCGILLGAVVNGVSLFIPCTVLCGILLEATVTGVKVMCISL